VSRGRNHQERLCDRLTSNETLLGRARRLSHALAGVEPEDGRPFRMDDPPLPAPAPIPLSAKRREELLEQLADDATPIRDRGPIPRPPIPRRSWTLPDCYGLRPGPGAVGITIEIAKQARKLVSALESCGHWRGVYQCPQHGAWAATSRCGHRLCILCQVHRRGDLLARYGAHITTRTNADGDPRSPMLTLTQQSEEGEHLSEAFGRLQVRHRAFCRQVQAELTGTKGTSKACLKSAKAERLGIGGLTSLEATPRPGKRWNAHAHVLLKEPDLVPERWTVPGWTKARPLDPWRFRLLWAGALLDTRKTEDAAAYRRLTRLYQLGRKRWIRKMKSKQRRARAKGLETKTLKRWLALCADLGVPAIVDLRDVHPAEAVKYITKGYQIRPREGEPLTDWHLWQLLIGTYYLRRTIPWGSLYRLPKPEAEEPPEEEVEQDHKSCPYCGADSPAVVRAAWAGSRAVSDSFLLALRLDRVSYSPRGPPLPVVPARPLAPLGALLSPGSESADLALSLALGEPPEPADLETAD